ncbi:hypothetical protein SCG7109_AE_00280 [Chlamydiales bacterium SCGC AG-110-M15]|nr:hypothetical protein SCG7109_AE_00280 [Chlamydiales bacterium SCGC AG-110-M15]
MRNTIALFGETEKGEYKTAYFCQSVVQLMDNFGHPPKESHGLHCAIQFIMHDCNLIFFRVQEEGYSIGDYLTGLSFLENNQFVSQLGALCLPGVGNSEIIEATSPVCGIHNSLLIMNEADLYDYLTESCYSL